MRSRLLVVHVGVLSALSAAAFFAGASAGARAAEKAEDGKKPAKITYEEHIRPIFRAKCFSCHNVDKKSGNLDLTNYTNLMQGGGSGEVIVRGSASDSYLLSLVTHESEPNMPPMSEKLPDEQLELIARWIEGGALENAGSKPVKSGKPKFELVLKSAPAGKPAEVAMPGRLALEPVVRTEQKAAVTALATSPWAPLAAVAGQKQVLLYHMKSLELEGVFPFPEGVPQVLKFSRNGRLLLAGGGRGAARGRVVVWDVTTGERVIEVGDELDEVLAADISADHSRIALGGPGKVVRIYSTQDGELLHEIRKHTDWIYSIAFSPDGVLLATGDRNGGLFVWESFTAREYLSLKGHGAGITGLTWRTDSNLLASCSEDASIRLWEMRNGGQLKSWSGHGGGTSDVEFTRDGRLVSCGRDRATKLWDQNGKQLRAFPAFEDIALRVTHCDETDRVVAGDWAGAVRVWNAAADPTRDKPLGELNTNPPKLAERLAAAQKAHSAKQAVHEKLAAAYEEAQGAADKAAVDLAAAEKTVAENRKGLEDAEKAVKQHKATIAQLTAEQQTAEKRAAELQPLLEPLKAAAEKAEEARSKAPEDKELAGAVGQLKAQLEKKTAERKQSVKTAAEKKDSLEKAGQQLAAAEKDVRETTAALQAAEKRVETLKPTVKPAADKAAEAKKAAEAAATALEAAKRAVDRWRDEIALLAKLDEIAARKGKLQELKVAAAEARTTAEQLKKEADAATAALQQAEKRAGDATTALESARKALEARTAEHGDALKAAEALEKALSVLTEAANKGKEAADGVKDDKELAAAAAQLASVLEKKQAELAALKKSVDEKAAGVEAAKSELAAAEKTAAESTAALKQARETAAGVTGRFEQAGKQAAAAQAAVEAAEEKIAGLRAAL